MRLIPLLFAIELLSAAPQATAILHIEVPSNPTSAENLAARELRRYYYLRSGRLARITPAASPSSGDGIVLERDPTLTEGRYRISSDGHRVRLAGGSSTGTLYAAYRFAEHLGVRFYLHGDVVPDARTSGGLPRIEETGAPLFDIRGIQPFHDFPEGPDWWNRDDYLAYIAQLPKLRMNFIGLHTYPEGPVGPEPAVWIGLAKDIGPGGKVDGGYPSQWANTARKGMWGYVPMKTSEFAGGAAQLFEADDFGPAVMNGLMPSPGNGEQSNLLFDQTAGLLRSAFTEARALGVKTCIGTETPLTIPKLVAERLKAQGRDPGDPAVARDLYEGMFRRIAREYPVDYYWLWTPEDWTWSGNKPEQFNGVAKDIGAALDALKASGSPFTLATSGWVLGPLHDRAALDRLLPPSSPMSCINRQVGHAPDEPGFANVSGRPKWVIPWMENDPDLTAPQPWVGRMRHDAVDARRLGCTGLLGIHWRTKILAGNVAALAAAAWDQSWVPASYDTRPLPPGQPDDPAAEGSGNNHPLRGRAMPVADFYADFARSSFGGEVGERAGRILASVDGTLLPEPATWLDGPGGIKPEKRPWAVVKAQYAFVDDLAGLRASVRGAGNLERFDYWLNTYRYMAAMAEAASIRGGLDAAVAALAAEQDGEKRRQLAAGALAQRTALARAWERMLWLQVASTDTPGELGTLANLEQHNRRQQKFLEAHDEALAKALGAPLPAAAEPSKGYYGPARIIVPTVRTLVDRGEPLSLKVIAIDSRPVKDVRLFWRELGTGRFKEAAARHLARAVYRIDLAPAQTDFEYYVEAKTASGARLVWPATAPSIPQTVVVH